MWKQFNSLISCARLREMLGKEKFHLIDTSSSDIRIPGAKFMDLNILKSPEGRIPSEEAFNAYMERIGIPNDHTPIIVYDKQGSITSPRAWYMFKVFGRSNVKVLDGGFPLWTRLNFPTEQSMPEFSRAGQYNYKLNWSMLRQYEDLLAHEGDLIDCRKPEVFYESHVPGARNVHSMLMFNADRTFKTPSQIRHIFEKARVSLDDHYPAIHMCANGMNACISILAMEISGKDEYALYDGSCMNYFANNHN